MSTIYVDHAATTPLHPQVLAAMLPYLGEQVGNPSSIHGYGRKIRASLDQARDQLALCLGLKDANQLVFTGGGTEADNLALIGIALANQQRGKHIITSKAEHHAVLHTCGFLEELGFQVTYVDVNEYGQVELQQLKEYIRPETILVSFMYGNNEVGSLNPLMEIGTYLREKEIYFHTDAVQALGVELIHLDQLPVDLLSASSHKINGPQGVGCLYVRQGVRIKPLLHGGSQERNRRAGTENVAGLIGFAKAVEIAYQELDTRRSNYTIFRQRMLDIFSAEDLQFSVNGDPKHVLPHILNVSFPGAKADALLMNLDLAGVAASSGSACTAGSLQPSHVLEAMYNAGDERIFSALRFSFGLGNTLAEVEQVALTTAKIVKRLQGIEKGGKA